MKMQVLVDSSPIQITCVEVHIPHLLEVMSGSNQLYGTSGLPTKTTTVFHLHAYRGGQFLHKIATQT